MSSPVSRRDFLSTSAQTATLAAVGIIPNTVDVRDFNAVGDGNKGQYSPNYGLVVRALSNCVVKDNVMHEGAMQELVVDQGGHGAGVILQDNVGSILKPNP